MHGYIEQKDHSCCGGTEQNDMRFYHTTQNTVQVKLINCLFLEFSTKYFYKLWKVKLHMGGIQHIFLKAKIPIHSPKLH